jgi:hypothetical protein
LNGREGKESNQIRLKKFSNNDSKLYSKLKVLLIPFSHLISDTVLIGQKSIARFPLTAVIMFDVSSSLR